jgi:hypothetical protein
MPHTCLGCQVIFSTRKKLSAHTPSCGDYAALSEAIFRRKRKSARSNHHQKSKKRRSISPQLQKSPEAGPSNIIYDQDIPADQNFEVSTTIAGCNLLVAC